MRALLFVALWLIGGCGLENPPPDSELILYFHKNRQSLVALYEISSRYPEATYISLEPVSPTTADEEARPHLIRAGLRRVVRREGPLVLFFLDRGATYEPLHEKGIAFSQQSPRNTLPSLDDLGAITSDRIHYSPIEDHWFIFYRPPS